MTNDSLNDTSKSGFEKWAKCLDYNINMYSGIDEKYGRTYALEETENAWHAWKEARKQYQADLVARLEDAQRAGSAKQYTAYSKAITIVRGGE